MEQPQEAPLPPPVAPKPPDPPVAPQNQIPRTPTAEPPPMQIPFPPIPVQQMPYQPGQPHVGMFHPQRTSAIAHAELTWRLSLLQVQHIQQQRHPTEVQLLQSCEGVCQCIMRVSLTQSVGLVHECKYHCMMMQTSNHTEYNLSCV